jgi:hypothetical protein
VGGSNPSGAHAQQPHRAIGSDVSSDATELLIWSQLGLRERTISVLLAKRRRRISRADSR